MLLAGIDARASYTFSTGTVTAAPVSFSGVSETFTPNAGTVPTDTSVNRSLVTISYNGVTATPVGPFTQTLTFLETLSSTTTGQTEVLSVNGTLTVNSASTAGVSAVFNTNSITVVSGSGFTLQSTGYATSTTNAGIADLGFNIIPPSLVPEPMSLVVLGSGLCGVLGLALYRQKKQA